MTHKIWPWKVRFHQWYRTKKQFIFFIIANLFWSVPVHILWTILVALIYCEIINSVALSKQLMKNSFMEKLWRSLNTSLAFSYIMPQLLLNPINIAIINNTYYYPLLIVIKPKPEGIKEFPSGVSSVMMCWKKILSRSRSSFGCKVVLRYLHWDCI